MKTTHLILRIFYAFVGFRMAGIPGLILGVVLGLAFDPKIEDKIAGSKSFGKLRQANLSEADQIFFKTTFSMFAKLARVDGHVCKSEIKATEHIIKEVFSLGAVGRRIAISIFNEAKVDNTSFYSHAVRFYELYSLKPVVLRTVMEALFTLSLADGEINSEEERLLKTASEIFGFDPLQFAAMASEFGGSDGRFASGSAAAGTSLKSSLEIAYRVLGCDSAVSDAEVKSRYRKLVQDYHPDKLVGKGLPDGFEKFAGEKFREIQNAFEEIKAFRNL